MSECHLAVRQWPIRIEWDCATWISTQRSGNVHTVDAAGAERVRCSCWECGDDIGGCGVVWIQASDAKVPSVGLYSNDKHHREQQCDPTFGPVSCESRPCASCWSILYFLSPLLLRRNSPFGTTHLCPMLPRRMFVYPLRR
jgi:hypothetical protein